MQLPWHAALSLMAFAHTYANACTIAADWQAVFQRFVRQSSSPDTTVTAELRMAALVALWPTTAVIGRLYLGRTHLNLAFSVSMLRGGVG